MSRQEEVEAELKSILERDEGMMKAWTGAYDLAHTLADEVDELTKVCADIAALEAERDELRRKLDAVVAMLEPDYSKDELYRENKHVERIHTRAVAIAEGRDNE